MPEIFEVTPGLYQGSHHRHLPDYVQAVLNVDSRPAFYKTENVQYTHMPIIDGPNPGEEWLERALTVLGDYRAAGLKTFVHCQAGMSRSVFVTAALLMREQGITRQEAIRLIDSKSHNADPAPAFLTALDKFYEKERMAREAVATP
jgi:protein-tyrosine phosphatase